MNEKTKNAPLILIVSIMVFVILGSTILIIGNTTPASQNASPLPSDELTEQSIPLIDLEAPRQFKTATFAMG